MSQLTPTDAPGEPGSMPSLDNLIPLPVSVTETGDTFTLTADADIYVEPGTAEIISIGQQLADRLNPSAGYEMEVLTAAGIPSPGNIHLTLIDDPELGEEGYILTITPDLVTLSANRPAGLFRGIQTIRQLLPPEIEAATVQSGPWVMAAGTIRDYPHFEWRGMMLDVSRHFFSVEDVKRTIDLIAYYKMNRLHLHLTDDQGWRLMIDSWPNLTAHGGSTAVGGDAGGYYTQADYAEIVAYAQSRYIMVIPEVDMPGHTNAALASYAELNCDGVSPPLYTGVEVGFSSLCVDAETTYSFIDDVIKELAALTPGPYIHIGGDEARATNADDYKHFIARVQTIVESHGKRMIGWEEISQADLNPTTIAQYWIGGLAAQAVQQGAKVIMSPGSKAYLDMQYNQSSPLGLNWAGYVDVKTAYGWEPSTLVDGISESDILGVEAPLWTETISTMDDIEYMVLPRLPGIAEIGWSPRAGRDWEEYKNRLGTHGPRLTAMDVNFYRSPLVPWSDE